MRISILILIAALALPNFVLCQAPTKTLVEIRLTDVGGESELPFIPTGGPVGVRNAQFSAMYFGPKKDSDLSFLVLAKFLRPRYSAKKSFGIKFVIDDKIPFSQNLRMVNRVAADEQGESLQFSVSEDEIAWLALGDRLEIEVYNADTQEKLDTYRFTAAGMRELKKFAMSVLLLRNLAH